MPKNLQKFEKIHDIDKTTLVFDFNSLFVFHPQAKHRKHKTNWVKTFFKMWSQIFEEKILNLP